MDRPAPGSCGPGTLTPTGNGFIVEGAGLLEIVWHGCQPRLLVGEHNVLELMLNRYGRDGIGRIRVTVERME